MSVTIKNEENTNATILDSGNRREFESGAVRDIQEGKGRCDLMPLDVVANVIGSPILSYISMFQESCDVNYLYKALWYYSEEYSNNYESMMLEVSKHYEDGCKKYGENNWRKGIPVHCYIDSAVRHYLKFKRGDTDERHDRAFMWNILGAIWTTIHKPELCGYPVDEKRG